MIWFALGVLTGIGLCVALIVWALLFNGNWVWR